MCLPLTSCTRVAAKANPRQTDAMPVRAVRAVSQDVPLEIAAVGNVEAMDSVEVKSRIAGQINRVAFAEGQSVTKGQLLFSIDREALERQARNSRPTSSAMPRWSSRPARLWRATPLAEKQSQSEADVARQLGTLGVISGQRVNQLVTTSDTAQAALRVRPGRGRGRSRRNQGRPRAPWRDPIATELHRCRRTHQRARRRGDGEGGQHGARQRHNARYRSAIGSHLRHLWDSRAEPARSAAAQCARATDREASNGDGAPLEGHLAFIDNTVDATTGTIRLKAVFPNTDNALWPGEFVNVRLRLGMETGRIVVPESSIQDGLDGKYVWLIKSGIATIAPVTVLRTYRPPNGPEQAIVGSGIKPGRHGRDRRAAPAHARRNDCIAERALAQPPALQHRNQPSTMTRATHVPRKVT